jgi:hypothetical protein
MCRVLKNALFCSLVILILCACGLSQTDARDEVSEFVEPIAIEETLPNAAGDWDLRLSCQYLHSSGEHSADCPRTQLFVGLPRRFGAEINLPFTTSTNPDYGFGDVSASVKYLFRTPNRRRPAIAFAVEAAFPTATAGEDGAFEIQPSLALLQQLGRATLQGNAGYSFAVGNAPAGVSQFQGGVSMAFPIVANRWYCLAEADGSGSELMLVPGVKYRVSDDRFFAFGLPVGVTAAAPRVGFIAQVQFSVRKSGSNEHPVRTDNHD